MENIAYYLKYRPQALDELVGQESVKKNLLSSFQNNKLSHAYLFVGPRGTGKTSTARILAKMVNCSAEKDIPCNKCEACVSITDGSNMDLIEIDAASNRGIEDIRSLRDKIKLAPTNAGKKVYIIDEVHMLTTEAFNALLKTLEEPPKHALFILATTEGSKVPSTILSRVQKLDFKLATTEELLEALKKIVSGEKIDIDEEALKNLVKKANGSFRDGVKLLDQVSMGEKITAKLVDDSLKSSQFENILDLVQSLKNKNTKEGLLNLSKQIENGVDVKELMFSLMDTLRNLVFIKKDLGEQLVKVHLTEDKYKQLEELAENFAADNLIKALDVLQSSLEKMKFASIPSLSLELAIMEICDSSIVIPSETRNLKIKSEDPSLVCLDQSRRVRDDKMEIIDNGKSRIVVEDSKMEDREEINLPPSTIKDLSSTVNDPSSNADILKLKEKWTFVLETIRPFNFSLEALLRSINIAECTESSVIMEVPYSFHQRILEAPKNRDLVEGILSDILGRSIRISTILGSRPERRDDVANIEVAQDDEIIRAAAEIFNSDTVN